jgi:hypothetical protein
VLYITEYDRPPVKRFQRQYIYLTASAFSVTCSTEVLRAGGRAGPEGAKPLAQAQHHGRTRQPPRSGSIPFHSARGRRLGTDGMARTIGSPHTSSTDATTSYAWKRPRALRLQARRWRPVTCHARLAVCARVLGSKPGARPPARSACPARTCGAHPSVHPACMQWQDIS